MTDYRHAGTFWPANAGGEHPDVETILRLPGSGSLIFVVADSARWWWRQIKARADLAVWRGLPRPDRLPAHLGWDAKKVAAECVNLWDEAPHSGTEWFTPLNELQFRRESGEDWKGYIDMAWKLGRLRVALRAEFSKRGQDVRLLFPAWVPGDDLDHIDEWIDEAMLWDGLRVHIYNNAGEVRSRYWHHRTELTARYGEIGRTHPILVDETNANHTGADEGEMVTANAEVCRDDPYCLGFCWYIWETNNAGERDLSVWGNGDRLALFRDPPTIEAAPTPAPEPQPAPTPTPEPENPMPEPKTREEVIAISNAVADEVGIPRLLLLACGIAESNLTWNARRPADPSQDAAYWTDVSHGAWQQTVRWSQEYKDWYTNDAPGHPPAQFPGADVTEAAGVHYYDVDHAARVAGAQLKAHYDATEDDAVAKALARYNFPAGDGSFKSPAIEQNYRRGVSEARTILGEAEPAPQPTGVLFEDYRDPQPAGTFDAMPKGIILHGSRSGKAGNPKATEYLGTARYEQSNTAGLGWHATIGEGKVAVHLTPQQWGWHALQASKVYIGVEFAQATLDEPITDAQVEAFAAWFKVDVLPIWPSIPLHFPSHAEVDQEFGVSQGKTDAFPLGDSRMDDLRSRIMAALGTADPKPAPSPYAVGPGILAKMAELGDTPAANERYIDGDWSEAVGMSGARYTYLKATNTVYVFKPAA